MDPRLIYKMWQASLHPPQPLPRILSFAQKTILVTGASGGLGLEAALLYAKHEASHIILGVRRPDAGEAAATKIKQLHPETRTTVMQVDMASYDSIQAFVGRIENEIERLDVAVLNAAVLKVAPSILSSNWEETVGVDTIGTTLLGLLLLPKLKAARPELQTIFNTKDEDNKADQFPRLVIVSSQAHVFLERNDLPLDDTPPLRYISNRAQGKGYKSGDQYALSKLALQWAVTKLRDIALEPSSKDPEVIVTSCCPGPTSSDLGREMASGPLGWLMRYGMEFFMKLFTRTAEEGARNVVMASAVEVEDHGAFWMENGVEK